MFCWRSTAHSFQLILFFSFFLIWWTGSSSCPWLNPFLQNILMIWRFSSKIPFNLVIAAQFTNNNLIPNSFQCFSIHCSIFLLIQHQLNQFCFWFFPSCRPLCIFESHDDIKNFEIIVKFSIVQLDTIKIIPWWWFQPIFI